MPGPGRSAQPRGPLGAAICAALAAIAMPARSAPPEHFNDDILFVGMSRGSAVEAHALRLSGARILAIEDAARPDRIRAEADGKEHDVSTEHGAQGFAATLGLSPAGARAVAAALVAAEPDARDELARIAEVWARAERGGGIPSRLVLSGHSAGTSFWGKGNGSLSLEVLRALAAALPAAAARVEDVLLAGCHTGGEHAMRRLKSIFPALRTAWSYFGSAPGAHHGATEHARRWERATRGRQDHLDPGAADGTRKGAAVTVWSVRGGYQAATPAAPLPALRAAAEQTAADFRRHLRGEVDVEHPQLGPLRAHYDAVQALLAAPELSEIERVLLTEHRDQAIRLLYYRPVAQRFAAAHAEAIRAGYAAVGLPAPDFAALPRGAALARIAALGEQVRGADPQPPDAAALLVLLEEGLRDLRPSRIPDWWM